MTGGLPALRAEIRALADPERAALQARYFRTGPGEYGEGDRFLGIRVPALRALARRHRQLPLEEALELLASPFHEERFVALLLMIERHRRGGVEEREVIHRAYLANTPRVNGWDLVDVSAEHLVGPHVGLEDPALLERLAASPIVWERRIAMLSTFHWTRRGEFRPALRVAELLLGDDHDLIHKAVGWMLREVGNRDRAEEEAFLRAHAPRMPRTALRYAVERFPEAERRAYLERGR